MDRDRFRPAETREQEVHQLESLRLKFRGAGECRPSHRATVLFLLVSVAVRLQQVGIAALPQLIIGWLVSHRNTCWLLLTGCSGQIFVLVPQRESRPGAPPPSSFVFYSNCSHRSCNLLSHSKQLPSTHTHTPVHDPLKHKLTSVEMLMPPP